MTVMLGLAWMSASTVLALVLTAGFRAYALRQRLLDIPNERSSHAAPVPRGGGVAIVVVVSTAAVLIAVTTPAWRTLALLVALAGGLVAFIGFVDDRRGVAASRRFAVHALAVAMLIFATRELGTLVLPGLPPVPAMHWALAMVALLWLLNLFNFMDGIDGIAAMEAVFVSLGLVACLCVGPGISAQALALCLATAGSALGFLAFNWPPARIFMGDVGSGFLGFILGALAVIAHRESGLAAWVPAILLGTFVTDATVTLLRRMARREKWYEAHRSHAYQWLSRRYGRHLPVTIGAAAVNLLWLLPLALAAARWPVYASVFTAIAYTPLIVLVILAGGGRAEAPLPTV